MATVNGVATSRSGLFSNTGSLNNAMVAARTLGANYTTSTVAEWYTLCLLMWVEFGTRNVQNVMAGASGLPYSSTHKATVAESGTNRIILSTSNASAFAVGQTINIGTSITGTSVAQNRIVTAVGDYDATNRAVYFSGAAVTVSVGNSAWTGAYKNGMCDGVLSSSGSHISNTDGKHNCMYRGVEAPFANGASWLCDVLIRREGDGSATPYTYNAYYLPNPTLYSGGTLTENYVLLSYTLGKTDGYITQLGLDERYPHVRLPITTAGSSTTYYADYYSKTAASLCVLRAGGNMTDGARMGISALQTNVVASASGADYHARLSLYRG